MVSTAFSLIDSGIPSWGASFLLEQFAVCPGIRMSYESSETSSKTAPHFNEG